VNLFRCYVVLLGVCALASGTLHLSQSHAQGAQEAAAVTQAIEDLRKAMLAADRTGLEHLVADQLSYGHSSGIVESKGQFIEVIADKKTVYKSISLSEPSVVVVGNNAIARHVFSAETESGGKAASARVGVMQVWVKEGDGGWKLLARQAFRLPA
jgi:ketosteroid isomerase-like protein